MCRQEGIAHGALLMIALGALLYLASVLLAPQAHSSTQTSETREVAVTQAGDEQFPVASALVGVEHVFAISAATSGPSAFGY